MRSGAGAIWLDAESAEREILAQQQRGLITADQAMHLGAFSRDGYVILHLELSELDTTAIDADVHRLWRERPANICYAYDSPAKRFSEASMAAERKPRHRILDLHAASATALRLYLHRTLHRYASLILGETAVATQSLYFEYGSQQPLHRDCTVVPTPVFGSLVGAWIALEDIAEGSGPLLYVPGSQRFPFYEFAPGRCVYDPSADTAPHVEEAMSFYSAQLAASGLPTHTFMARRGDVLLWHSALFHGGAIPRDEGLTRKSFVVHYSAERSYRERMAAVTESLGDRYTQSVYVTNERVTHDGAAGFANALDGRFLYRR